MGYCFMYIFRYKNAWKKSNGGAKCNVTAVADKYKKAIHKNSMSTPKKQTTNNNNNQTKKTTQHAY